MPRLELFGVLRLRTGITHLDVGGTTLGDALSELEARFPELRGVVMVDGQLSPAYRAALNGDRFVADLSTKLRPNDAVVLLSGDPGG